MFIPPLSCPDGRQSGNTLFWKRVKLWLAWISTSLGKRPKCQSWTQYFDIFNQTLQGFFPLLCHHLTWEKSQNVSLIQSNKGSYCFGFIIWYALELEYVENELKVRCQQLMNINWLIFLSFFLISLCLNYFVSSFSSILTEKPY